MSVQEKQSLSTLLFALGVSNFQRAISMVIPRSRSALSLSRTQAYLKEPSVCDRMHGVSVNCCQS